MTREGTLKVQWVDPKWVEQVMDYFRPKTWPEWLCWLFGHEPTESILTHKAARCRCNKVQMGDEELLLAGRPNWWTRLIRRLPARRANPWGLAVTSDYREHAEGILHGRC